MDDYQAIRVERARVAIITLSRPDALSALNIQIMLEVIDATTRIDDADRCVTAEILHELLPSRRARANPRGVKRKMSVYQIKHPHHWNAPVIEHRRWSPLSSKRY
jgi:hypothetical protein